MSKQEITRIPVTSMVNCVVFWLLIYFCQANVCCAKQVFVRTGFMKLSPGPIPESGWKMWLSFDYTSVWQIGGKQLPTLPDSEESSLKVNQSVHVLMPKFDTINSVALLRVDPKLVISKDSDYVTCQTKLKDWEKSISFCK